MSRDKKILLSACLIVRDEERHLRECLSSIAPLVDEIIVADTGSADRTKEIALGSGARVFDCKWTDNFARARNFAIRRARGKWILSLDADERVRPCKRESLAKALSRVSTAALWSTIYTRPGHTPVPTLRLFRNHPLLRFRGAFHENIQEGLRKHLDNFGSRVETGPLTIDHIGYEGDQRRKLLRNERLIRAYLESDPGSLHHWCHLATVYEALGKRGLARQAWTQAIARVRRKSGHYSAGALAYAGLIRSTSNPIKARQWIDESLSWFPTNPDLAGLRGADLMKQGEYRAAIGVFKRMVSLARRFSAIDVSYDKRGLEVFADVSMASCYYHLKDFVRAERIYSRLYALDPGNPDYRRMTQLCRGMLRR